MLLSDTPLHVLSSGRGRQAITLLQEVEWGHVPHGQSCYICLQLEVKAG